MGAHKPGFVAVGLLLIIAQGCSVFPPERSVEITKAVLNATPSEVPRRPTHVATLLVLTPETVPLLDTTKMAYSSKPYEIDYYRDTEWGEKPALMIETALITTLQKTDYFSAVQASPFTGAHTYTLASTLLDLTQDYTSKPPVLRLSMTFRLTGKSGEQASATTQLTVRQPMRGESAYAGTVAANEALAKLLTQVSDFVIDKVNEHAAAIGAR